MRLSSKNDLKACSSIIASTFAENPSVNVVIGANGNKTKKLQRLAAYAFIKALNRGGAYLSENGKGVAFIYKSDAKGWNLYEQWLELRFALSLGIKGIFKVLKREAFLKSHRYTERHYYFWFLGVEKGGDKAAFELRDGIFQLANQDQLPIVLETSVWRNVEAYQRYGFTVYHEWIDDINGITVWFMKRMPRNR